MSLLNWLGLLWLLVVPALILLYMFRPARLRKAVPSLRLWHQLPQMERTRSRLRRPPLSLLLVLQAVALLVGALALAQPALTAPAGRDVVLIIDASGSMQALNNSVSRFDQARAEAHKVAKSLGGQDHVTLLRAGANVSTACAACTPGDAERALDAMTTGAGGADVSGALAVAAGLGRQSPGAVDVVVISDGDTPPAARGLPFSLRYIEVGAPVDDVAVATLSARRPPDGQAGYIAYARIENRGKSDATIQVSAQADNVPLPARSETVPDGGHLGITWQVPAGTARFSVSVSPSDALPGDDRAVIFLPAAGQYTVDVTSPQPDLYVRALGSIDGLNVLTNTNSLSATVPSATSPQSGAAFNIIVGKLPDPLPAGNLLLVNPDGDLLHSTGTLTDMRPTVVDGSHPLMSGLDLNALQVNNASAYDAPDWMQTVVDSAKGPLVLAGEHDGRRIAVLTFDPSHANLPKLAAFPLLMANLVDWLYPLVDTQSVLPGQPVRLTVDSTVRTPSGRTLPVSPSGLFSDTDEEGTYEVTGPASVTTLQFAVNMADDSQNSITPDHPLDRTVQAGPANPPGQVTSQVFWLPLAALALALFGGEWFLYCWKRGSA